VAKRDLPNELQELRRAMRTPEARARGRSASLLRDVRGPKELAADRAVVGVLQAGPGPNGLKLRFADPVKPTRTAGINPDVAAGMSPGQCVAAIVQWQTEVRRWQALSMDALTTPADLAAAVSAALDAVPARHRRPLGKAVAVLEPRLAVAMLQSQAAALLPTGVVHRTISTLLQGAPLTQARRLLTSLAASGRADLVSRSDRWEDVDTSVLLRSDVVGHAPESVVAQRLDQVFPGLRERFVLSAHVPQPHRLAALQAASVDPTFDDELAARWAGDRGGAHPEAEQAIKMQMRSARWSERAASAVFTSLGHTVEDVAAGQLRGGEDWPLFDLRLDGSIPVDVKSARRSRGRDRYSSWCVPRHKLDRASRQVQICGVLAPYLTAEAFAEDRRAALSRAKPFVFLGITDVEALSDLARVFNGPRFAVSLADAHFLPPWVFSLSPEHRATPPALDLPLEPPAPAVLQAAGVTPLPLLLASGRPLPEAWLNELTPETGGLFRALQQPNEPMELPRVYLSALVHFLRAAATGRPDEAIARLRQVLLARTPMDARCFVPALHDPLRMVPTLIDTLEALAASAAAEELQRFQSFDLRGTGILRGSRGDGSRQTLVAYCGGRKPNRAVCGRAPLVWGREATCAVCGFLVCPDCAFCRTECSDSRNVAERSRQRGGES
jgi:hypothetical protein